MDRKEKRAKERYTLKLQKARDRELYKAKKEVQKLMEYPVKFLNEEEWHAHLDELLQRHKDGKKLSAKEIEFLCSGMQYKVKAQFSICDDHRFYELYLDHAFVNYPMTLSENYSPRELTFIENEKFTPQANEERVKELKNFYQDWEAKILQEEQSDDKVYMAVRQETKNMLQEMEDASRGVSSNEIENRKKELILRSKATYVKAKNILNDLGNDCFVISFCGQEVHIDAYSLVHILYRHYAELTKQHNDSRSYFSPEIPTELLMIRLKEILEKIETSAVIKGPFPQDIFFNFFGRLYRVYFKRFGKSAKGRGNYQVQRVNTFYPVNAKKDIDDSNKLKPISIEKWLKVYV